MPTKRTTTKAAAPEAVKTAAEATKTETEVKAAAPEKTAEKKQPVKRAAAKRTSTAKKAAEKAAVKKEVYVQCFGKELNVEGIESSVKQAWMNETGKKESDIKEIKIYIKPEENAAYYVVNGEYKEEGNRVEL